MYICIYYIYVWCGLAWERALQEQEVFSSPCDYCNARVPMCVTVTMHTARGRLAQQAYIYSTGRGYLAHQDSRVVRARGSCHHISLCAYVCVRMYVCRCVYVGFEVTENLHENPKTEASSKAEASSIDTTALRDSREHYRQAQTPTMASTKPPDSPLFDPSSTDR